MTEITTPWIGTTNIDDRRSRRRRVALRSHLSRVGRRAARHLTRPDAAAPLPSDRALRDVGQYERHPR